MLSIHPSVASEETPDFGDFRYERQLVGVLVDLTHAIRRQGHTILEQEQRIAALERRLGILSLGKAGAA